MGAKERSLLMEQARGPGRLAILDAPGICGNGVLADCAAALWASLDAAGAELESEQGSDPAAWRKSTEVERTRFAPGLISKTIAFSNRPTFQQAISFSGGRR
jgi:hypothetical protein